MPTAPRPRYRHWVFTIPRILRNVFRKDPEHLTVLCHLVAQTLQDWLREQAGLPDGRAGIVLAIYMVGLVLKPEGLNLSIAAAAREKGLLIVPAGHNTIRLLPALIATPEQLSEAVSILDAAFSHIES